MIRAEQNLTRARAGWIGHRGEVTAVLSYLLDQRQCANPPAALPLNRPLRSPWDVWWISYRAGVPAAELGLDISHTATDCHRCRDDVTALVRPGTVSHPGAIDDHRCGCLRSWAISMRSPEPELPWPGLHLSVARAKPGSDAGAVAGALGEHFTIEDHWLKWLDLRDVRRLYPEAYGAVFVDAQDTYLTSGPVTVLVLRAQTPRLATTDLKRRIRRALAGTDRLRNHLHMPDNPGETWCDLTHLTGPELTCDLYRRYDRAATATRLDHYRALLGRRPAGPMAS